MVKQPEHFGSPYNIEYSEKLKKFPVDRSDQLTALQIWSGEILGRGQILVLRVASCPTNGKHYEPLTTQVSTISKNKKRGISAASEPVV